MKSIDWDKVWPEQFLGIVCHHFFSFSDPHRAAVPRRAGEDPSAGGGQEEAR